MFVYYFLLVTKSTVMHLKVLRLFLITYIRVNKHKFNTFIT